MGTKRTLCPRLNSQGRIVKAILTWHSIDDSDSVISVSAAQLERQLDWLASGRVAVMRLSKLVTASDDKDAVSLTFDDGFENFFSVAAPMLVERALPATVFVVPENVGRTNTWDDGKGGIAIPSLPLMSWDDIRAVKDAGIDIGGHGMTHVSLEGLSGESLGREISNCADIIESETGSRPMNFAYPYGNHDAASVAAVSQFFSYACTTRFGMVTSSSLPCELPRLDTYYFRDNRMLEEWGTARFMGYVGLRKAGRNLRAALDTASWRAR